VTSEYKEYNSFKEMNSSVQHYVLNIDQKLIFHGYKRFSFQINAVLFYYFYTSTNPEKSITISTKNINYNCFQHWY